jgi:FG-GAP-like repeat
MVILSFKTICPGILFNSIKKKIKKTCMLQKILALCFTSLISFTASSQTIPFQKKMLLDSVALHPHIYDVNRDGLNDIILVSNYCDEKETDSNIKNLCWLEAPSWKQHIIAQLVYRSCHLALSDMDNDGWIDVIGSDDKDGEDANGNEGMFWMKNPGNSKTDWVYTRVGMTPYTKDILSADFDGDGKMDIVSRSLHPLPDGSHGSHLDMFFQETNGLFTKKKIDTPPFDGTALADVDRDGNKDIVINGAWLCNPGARNGNWKMYNYDSTWYTMSEHGKAEWNHNNCRLSVADIDQDGIKDVVIASGESTGYPIVWYKAPIDPKTMKWKKFLIDDKAAFTHTVRTGDMDNDGDIDIVTGELIFWSDKTPEQTPHLLRIYKNNGDGTKWEKQILDTKGIYSGIVGDIGNDGDLDILGPRNYNKAPFNFWENKTSDNKLTADKFTYFPIDTSRAKWGDFAPPEWLRYFGCDAKDVTGDGFAEIVSGRYVYQNPGGTMEKKWRRSDLGENLDGMLWADVDGDENADIIAEALPGIYWMEATDKTLTRWKKTLIASIKETDHVNGQGYKLKQVIPGGKPEIILNGGDGLYMLEIPDSHPDDGNWPKTLISSAETNDEGITTGDVDNDGDIDIISSRNNGIGPKTFIWYANPGNGKERAPNWKESLVGSVNFWADRVEAADLNGDGLLDIVASEERWPGFEPDASLFWFEQKRDFGCILWVRHTLKTSYSMNNLDIADIDKDGDIDIVTNEHKGTQFPTYLFMNNGKGSFSETIIDKGHEHHLGTRLFDLDGDGDLDIYGPSWDYWKPFHLLRNDAKQVYTEDKTQAGKVRIVSTNNDGTPVFKIETPVASYFLQKEAGGLSSMIDNQGKDWIAWRDMGTDQYPASAAGDFRGIPNMNNADGITHPGFMECNSTMLDDNAILVESKNGEWAYRWTFYDSYFKISVLKSPADKKFWCLYEGPIAGSFNPREQSWGTNKDGLRKDKPDFNTGEGITENIDFAFFGANKGKNLLYMTTSQDGDGLPDSFGWMGDTLKAIPRNGMVVFGFGRGKNSSAHFDRPTSFYFGFLQQNILARNITATVKLTIDKIRKN